MIEIEQIACHHHGQGRRRFAHFRFLACKIRVVAGCVNEKDWPAVGAAVHSAAAVGRHRGAARHFAARDRCGPRRAHYVVTSQPMSIMVLTQSSGKYDIHCKMFSSERAASPKGSGMSPGVAASAGSAGSSKAGCGIRVFVSTDLLPF
jgi:hypothetical protein